MYVCIVGFNVGAGVLRAQQHWRQVSKCGYFTMVLSIQQQWSRRLQVLYADTTTPLALAVLQTTVYKSEVWLVTYTKNKD